MAGDLTRYRGDVPQRVGRRLGSKLDRLEQDRHLEVARIEARAEVQATRADAVTFVGQVAMHDVAMLSQLEAQLSQVVPMATSRLQALGDVAALSLAEVVANTARRCR
jgi:hypothetical protein